MLKHFCYLKVATHFMCSKKLTKCKYLSEKQKGFRDGLSYSTPQKSEETRGYVITQPWSHPIPKFYRNTLTDLSKRNILLAK